MGPDLQIVGAGLWGGYTFFYKEIRVPKTAPINISMNLQLKKVGSGVGKNPLVAVEMRVSATNPSSRKVYLLPNAWIVRGYKVAYRESENSESFSKLAKTTLKARDGGYLERYSSVDASSALAVGELFTDKWLNPNETVARTIVLHIPRNQYDVIDAATYMPSAEDTRQFGFKFSIENEALIGVLCRQGANGECLPVEEGKEGGYGAVGIGYQLASSESQLSLWE